MANIAVIGAGAWGSALNYALGVKNTSANASATGRKNSELISLDDALKSEYIVFAIATQSTREFLKKNSSKISKNAKILVAQKGIETSTGAFLHEIFSEFFDSKNLAFLSGPSFASEVEKNLPCAVVVSAFDESLSKQWAEFFPPFMKSYESSDVIGTEICGAYKNVIAIAGGICDGMGLGNNARASLMARGLVEMARFGQAFGAKIESFLGLSGAGDLFLSASSELSRNFRVGKMLAKGADLATILEHLGEVAEGVPTAHAVVNISAKNSIYTPIANQISQVINGKDVRQALVDLLKKN